MGVFWVAAERLCKWLCRVYLQPMKMFPYFARVLSLCACFCFFCVCLEDV